MARSSHAVAAAPAPTTSALRRVVAGVMMMLLAAALGVNGLVAGSASAQEVEDDLGGGAGGAEGTTEEVEILELALYASSLAETVPDTLRSGVPPAVVCVVANELGICPESTAPLRNTISEGFNSLLDATPAEPFHPVPPDTIAVSVLAGADRYQTAVRFDEPSIPEGEEYTSFEMRFPVTQPTFDVNSPAFRRAVLGLFQSIAEGNDPAFFFEGLEEALTDESAFDINDDILGIEVCPFTAPFEPGGPPAAQDAEEDLPRDDEFGDVEIDCLLGASAQVDEDTEEYVFDLTFAANAWASGELENLGILMRPTGVENLAFGDEDFSTSAQISLDTEDVTVTFASAEPPPPPGEFADDFDDGFDDDFAEEGFDEGFDEGFAEEGFADGGFVDDGFQEMDGFEPGNAIGGPSDADGPAVADGTEEPLAADGEGQQQQVMTRPARGEPINPWWLWMLVPLFGGGGYLVAAPLLAPTAAAGGGTPGALSRLLARSGSGLAT